MKKIFYFLLFVLPVTFLANIFYLMSVIKYRIIYEDKYLLSIAGDYSIGDKVLAFGKESLITQKSREKVGTKIVKIGTILISRPRYENFYSFADNTAKIKESEITGKIISKKGSAEFTNFEKILKKNKIFIITVFIQGALVIILLIFIGFGKEIY